MTDIINEATARRWDHMVSGTHHILEDAFHNIVRDPDLGTRPAGAIRIEHTSSGFRMTLSEVTNDQAEKVWKLVTQAAHERGWGFSTELDMKLPNPGSRRISMSFTHPSLLSRMG